MDLNKFINKPRSTSRKLDASWSIDAMNDIKDMSDEYAQKKWDEEVFKRKLDYFANDVPFDISDLGERPKTLLEKLSFEITTELDKEILNTIKHGINISKESDDE